MRTSLIGAILAALLLGPTGVQADDVTTDAPASEEVKPATPPPAKDCHGPLYYRLKEQDRQNRQAEADVGVMGAFVARVAPSLFDAHKEEMATRLATQRADHAKCLSGKAKPSLFCAAMARRDAGLCDGLPTPELQLPCRQVLQMYGAVTAKDPERCQAMGDEGSAALCRFVVSGQFACGSLNEELSGPCKALAAHLESGTELSASLPAELLSALQWIAAIKTQQSEACDALADLADRQACKALLQANRNQCKADRQIDEFVDGDFTCREPLVYQAEHPAAWGNLVVVTIASSYTGAGQCEVFVDLLEDGHKRTMRAGEVLLPEHGVWEHLHVWTGKGRLIDVRVPCQWTEPGSVTSGAGN